MLIVAAAQYLRPDPEISAVRAPSLLVLAALDCAGAVFLTYVAKLGPTGKIAARSRVREERGGLLRSPRRVRAKDRAAPHE